MYGGLCEFLGIDTKRVQDTDNGERDLTERLNLAIEHLDRYDFIHIHTKIPDQAAHTKDPLKKKAAIESADRALGKSLSRLLDIPDLLVIVTSDHSTPSGGPLIHSGEAVPITLVGPNIRRDRVDQFDEIHCAAGSLGILREAEFMYTVLNCLDRAKLAGIMDTPVNQPYWPGPSLPFRIR